MTDLTRQPGASLEIEHADVLEGELIEETAQWPLECAPEFGTAPRPQHHQTAQNVREVTVTATVTVTVTVIVTIATTTLGVCV